MISVIVAALYSISRSRIPITRTKTKSPQTNGICERFHKTVLNEFYCGAFRKKVVPFELQADLDSVDSTACSPSAQPGISGVVLNLKVGGQNAAVRRVSQARRHDGGGHVMTLTLRPTGLAAPVDGDHKDFIVMSGEFVLGRLYEECGARPELRWYWAINGVHAGPTVIRKDGRARSLEGAKAQFADNWQKWLAWAGLKEVE